MRGQIEEQITAGMSNEDIVAGFVEEYGKVVLATPPPEGLNLAAWVMPGFAVLIGTFLALYFVSDWLAKKKIKPASAAAKLDPVLTADIEKELEKMDR